MERKYRIKANVGSDNVLNVNLKQDIDLYEILSIGISEDDINNLRRESSYKLFSSDYGVVIGRVLANDAFGVPNAKVSVFIPITDKDKLRTDVKNLYPYSFVTDYNKDKIRYNTLPDYSVSECYTPVGTFPSKAYMLDNDSILEIYDKYYKYTTVTNDAGDYMIFGVPTGEQIIHTDIDLSDIGVLSQRPSDFIAKGYTESMFENSAKFKKSTNLDDLAQIFSDNTTVTVYPFWGDRDADEIAITRKDIRLQYKFETTCVFLGSIITDNTTNSISHKCVPDLKMGDASQLTAGTGKIEMIRKTIDDAVEGYSINGNDLINSDGVFCYQIPMNLDFVGTDEYGNIVPTDNPKKGIPTRARVRFRITLDESGSEALSTHKARYLIPNNPDLNDEYTLPMVKERVLNTDDYYQFGSATPDECFRDLYWNKVYSIKNYIPRVQVNSEIEREQNYLAIKGINKKGARGINHIPYNKLNLNTPISAFEVLNRILGDKEYKKIFRTVWDFISGNYNNLKYDSVVETLADETDAIGLDFYNDWLNGCLYFPNWFWRSSNNSKEFCDCKNESYNVYLTTSGSLPYTGRELEVDYDKINNPDGLDIVINKLTYGYKRLETGLIKKVTNKDNAEIFYYAFGNGIYDDTSSKSDSDGEKLAEYARLLSTDLILLGSITDNDFHGIPKVSKSYPSTTCTIPTLGIYKQDEEGDATEYPESNNISYNGMNWGSIWYTDSVEFKNYYNGLFFGLVKTSITIWDWILIPRTIYVFAAMTNIKTYPNVERICELDVSLDSNYTIKVEDDYGITKEYTMKMDGLITRREIQSHETRSLFATLNSNKLIGTKVDELTGYKKYDLYYFYPTDFDGRLNDISWAWAKRNDVRSKDYVDFRLGFGENENTNPKIESGKNYKHYYLANSSEMEYAFPLYNNSYYFYFGLNPGKTAIDKFYKEYANECSTPEIENPFSIDVRVYGASYCSPTAEVFVGLKGYVNYPCQLVLSGNNNKWTYIISKYGEGYYRYGLARGSYIITATDSYGNVVQQSFTIEVSPIRLLYETKNIIIETDEDIQDICTNDNVYGKIIFNSYKVDVIGTTSNIDIFDVETIDVEGKTIKFRINRGDVTIELSTQNYSSIYDCLCNDGSGGFVFYDGENYYLKIKEPDNYYVRITDKSNSGCDNYSIYYINVYLTDLRPKEEQKNE